MSIFEDFDKYYEAVLKRNSETHDDGHLIVFNIGEEMLSTKKEYFEKCMKDQLSPYKALTFMDIGMN